MHFAAILVLEAAPDLEHETVRDLFAKRIRTVPRLRQRLARAPFGGGRPYWFDDPEFDMKIMSAAFAAQRPETNEHCLT